jgi:hypothetical protein
VVLERGIYKLLFVAWTNESRRPLANAIITATGERVGSLNRVYVANDLGKSFDVDTSSVTGIHHGCHRLRARIQNLGNADKIHR